jgi:8-oxo-dGTP diphosphatase
MQVVVGVAVVHAGRVLAARRCYPPELAGRWEFPGGKVGHDETAEGAAVREIAEELGCGVAVTGWLDPEVEIRTDVVLRVATAVLVDGEPVPRHGEHDAVRWLSADQLDAVDWLEADRPFTAALAENALGVSN